MRPPAPVSVIVPTVGRRDLLEQCLLSVLHCATPAAEVVVVDQSPSDDVARLIDGLAVPQLRRVGCDGVGISRAMNRGLAEVRHDTVLVTHDDCTVAPDWVERAAGHARAHPGGIVTGRVLPPDGSAYVPSTKSDPRPRDFTGTLTSGVLYPANMVASRAAIQAIGGFDERPSLRLAAEDNDLCYRWLAAGRILRYEPDLVVWHHDWRTPEELVRTHVTYARAQGGYYAKHLYARDLRILRLLRWDVRQGLRSVALGRLRGKPRWQDPYREMPVGLLVGMVEGWREARALDRAGYRGSRSASPG
ncbi:MAG: glycosyltransferase family 2 protein [Acidimicrobiales bacterium]